MHHQHVAWPASSSRCCASVTQQAVSCWLLAAQHGRGSAAPAAGSRVGCWPRLLHRHNTRRRRQRFGCTARLHIRAGSIQRLLSGSSFPALPLSDRCCPLDCVMSVTRVAGSRRKRGSLASSTACMTRPTCRHSHPPGTAPAAAQTGRLCRLLARSDALRRPQSLLQPQPPAAAARRLRAMHACRRRCTSRPGGALRVSPAFFPHEHACAHAFESGSERRYLRHGCCA